MGSVGKASQSLHHKTLSELVAIVAYVNTYICRFTRLSNFQLFINETQGTNIKRIEEPKTIFVFSSNTI